MKMLAFLALCLFCTLACSERPDSLAKNCCPPSPTSDSAQLADFRQHIQFRYAPDPVIPESDTMYRFRGTAGWGDFDYLCSVYRDSAGYKASFMHITDLNPHDSSVTTFGEQIKPIGYWEWKQIQSEFQQLNFWNAPFEENSVCIDASTYRIWAKEGAKFRLVSWRECDTKSDSLRILGKKIRDLCDFPTHLGTAYYYVKRDSVYLDYFSGSYEVIYSKKIDYQYNGKSLDQENGLAKLVLHKRDLDQIKKVIIIEYGIDGSVRRFNVSNVQQQQPQ